MDTFQAYLTHRMNAYLTRRRHFLRTEIATIQAELNDLDDILGEGKTPRMAKLKAAQPTPLKKKKRRKFKRAESITAVVLGIVEQAQGGITARECLNAVIAKGKEAGMSTVSGVLSTAKTAGRLGYDNGRYLHIKKLKARKSPSKVPNSGPDFPSRQVLAA